MKNLLKKRNKPPPDNLPIASILDCISEVVQIVDENWNFFYINQAAADLNGKIARDVRGQNVWEAFPELIGSTLETACRRAMREQVRIDLEFYFSRCAKSFEIHLHPTSQYLTLYATEITRSLRAEAHLEHLAEIEALNARLQQTNEALVLSVVGQQELTERVELLNTRLIRAMQESHHRIKNNLQVVAALVEMQMGEAGEAAGDEHLQRINLHIRALAGIHDLLTYQVKSDGNTDYLGTRAVLGRLIPMLQETSGGRHITADIADVLLSTEKVTALSLLLSECISNAIKHSKGAVEVTLRVEGNKAHLEVCDDGHGFVPDFNPREAARTGLALIDSTARHDLRGQVHYDNHSGGGGRVIVIFPITRILST
ncbi:MAG: two-component sensor histidine kinase [Chthonomonadales bacterium]|nr:two-component sensor histidine kinase [Chthonomonadales bacterium]